MRQLLLVLVCFALNACAATQTTTGRYYPVHPRQGEIRLDGRLDEAAWAKAPAGTGFMVLGAPGLYHTDRQSTFRILYDDEALYIGLRTSEPRMDEVKLRFGDGDMLWVDDSFELFFFPDTLPSYYQLVCTVNGSRWNSYRPEGPSPEPWDWQVAPQRGDNFYVLEVRIPLKLLGGVPKAGSRWRGNFCRNCRPGNRRILSTWSALGSGFHETDRFGTLEFMARPVSEADAVEITRRINDDFYQAIEESVGEIQRSAPDYVADLERACEDSEFGPRAKTLLAEWTQLNAAAKDRDLLGMGKAEDLIERSDAVRYGFLLGKLIK